MTARADAAGGSPLVLRGALLLSGAVLSLTPLATPAMALASGIAIAVIVGNPWTRLTGGVSSWLLKVAVVALGCGIPLDRLLRGGVSGLLFTCAVIVAVMTAGTLLGRWLGVDKHLTTLISAGTSICGGSAIAAVGPAIGASREAMSMSLATVFVLNAVALYLFPPIGHMVGLTEHQFGVWAALAIHDTSSVVGAAAAYGPVALQEATVLKLARALWILPLALIAPLVLRGAGEKTERVKPPVPWFIALFVLSAVARALAPATRMGFFDSVATLARTALVLTLFLIGASITSKEIRSVGFRPFVHGVVLWLLVGIPTLLVVMLAL